MIMVYHVLKSLLIAFSSCQKFVAPCKEMVLILSVACQSGLYSYFDERYNWKLDSRVPGCYFLDGAFHKTVRESLNKQHSLMYYMCFLVNFNVMYLLLLI